VSNASPTVSSYLYKITPFANLSLAALSGTTEIDAAKTFNTNVPFGMAMVIRRIHSKWWRSTIDAAHIGTELLVAQLTEATGATKPNAGDPLAMWTDVSSYTQSAPAAVLNQWEPTFNRFEYLPPHPGVPTMAQQLNVVISGNNVDAVHTQVSVWTFFMEIYYELIVLTQGLKDYLANRISVQRTT
jgi:hypothetical protein